MKMQYSSEYKIPKLQGMTPSSPSAGDSHPPLSQNKGSSFKEGDVHLVSHSPVPCLRPPPPPVQLRHRHVIPSSAVNYSRILPKITQGPMEPMHAK